MKDDVETWEQKKGIDFLKRIGIEEGDCVLDFGSGYGHYSIPAAKVVGKSGVIYAVEKDRKTLKNLREKRNRMGLTQMRLIETGGSMNLDIEDAKVDFCLLFDVLHYFDKDDRKKLYKEIKRLVREDGILSIYPKHTVSDFAMDNFKKMTKRDVINEIENSSFEHEEKICDELIHDKSMISGCVFNFTHS